MSYYLYNLIAYDKELEDLRCIKMSKELNINENINVINYVAEIKSKIEPYINLTGTALATARTDINKIFNEYDAQRIKITKELTSYIKDQMEPLIKLKKDADVAYKADEDARKKAKLIEVMVYYKDNYADEFSNFKELWPLINDERWQNLTYKEAEWQSDIDNKMNKIKSDLKIIKQLNFNEDDYFTDINLDRLIAENETIVEAEFTEPVESIEPLKNINKPEQVAPGTPQIVKRYSFNVVVDDEKKAALIAFFRNK